MATSDADLRDELDEDSKRLLRSVDEIRRLEKEKRTVPMSTPRFHELAKAVESASKDVFDQSRVESRDGDELSQPQGTTIDEVARRKDADGRNGHDHDAAAG
jgi:hypothetical protein